MTVRETQVPLFVNSQSRTQCFSLKKTTSFSVFLLTNMLIGLIDIPKFFNSYHISLTYKRITICMKVVKQPSLHMIHYYVDWRKISWNLMTWLYSFYAGNLLRPESTCLTGGFFYQTFNHISSIAGLKNYLNQILNVF